MTHSFPTRLSFDLWKQIDAAHDKHVVAATSDLADAAHAARRGRQQASQVTRAITYHRHGFLGQRREHQFAFFAIGHHLARFRVDDLGIEMVFPHHRTVFGFDALHSHARPHDFRQAVDVQRVDAPTLFDVFTHMTRPGLRHDYAYAQRAFAGVHAQIGRAHV